MRGIHIDTLNVYIKFTSNDLNESLVWSKQGNQGNGWINGKVNLLDIDKEYKIIFEGIKGNGHLGDIGINS